MHVFSAIKGKRIFCLNFLIINPIQIIYVPKPMFSRSRNLIMSLVCPSDDLLDRNYNRPSCNKIAFCKVTNTNLQHPQLLFYVSTSKSLLCSYTTHSSLFRCDTCQNGKGKLHYLQRTIYWWAAIQCSQSEGMR